MAAETGMVQVLMVRNGLSATSISQLGRIGKNEAHGIRMQSWQDRNSFVDMLVQELRIHCNALINRVRRNAQLSRPKGLPRL